MATEEKDSLKGKRSVTPKGQRRTKNPCILSDGSVDPKCGTYQRSVAGRQKLDDYVKQLDSQGVSEKDIFMAAVKSLTTRGHGYVGAYLDSKNPNRRYEENQAMAIADSVMTKAGVGKNPGERLTAEKDDEKGEREEKRKSAPSPEPGKKAAPVGQQRKQPGGRNEAPMGMPETWAKAGRGVDKDLVERRRREGQPDVEPGEIKSDVDVDKEKGTAPSRPETKPKREEKIPETAAQRFTKSLSKAPEPTESQQKEIDEIMAAREEMDPEEWKKSLTDLLDKVKESGGVQRQDLRKYLEDLKSGVGRRTAPLPGSAAAAARDASIEKGQEAKEKSQELRQQRAQEVREDKSKAEEEQKRIDEDKEIEGEIPVDGESPGEEEQGKLKVSSEEIANKFRGKYNQEKKSALERAQAAARRKGEISPKSVDLSPDDLEFLAQDTLDELSEEFDVDRKFAIDYINKKFGLSIPLPEEEKAAPSQPGPEPPDQPGKEQKRAAPGRESMPEERLGLKGKASASDRGFKVSPKDVSKVKQSVEKAKEQGLSAKEVAKQYVNGTLFPSGLVTDTSDTNPLEGGSTPDREEGSAPASMPEEKGGSLLDEEGSAKDFRRSGPAPREKTRQIPLQLGRENTSQRLATRAKVEQGRLVKEEKKLGKPPAKPRKRGKAPVQPGLFTPSGKPRKFNTSEMSYEEFSQTIRSLIR
jgi:hypothetical protein